MFSRFFTSIFALSLLFLSVVSPAVASSTWQSMSGNGYAEVYPAPKGSVQEQYLVLLDGKLYGAGVDNKLTLLSDDAIRQVYATPSGDLYALKGMDKQSLYIGKWDPLQSSWTKICSAPPNTDRFAVTSSGAIVYGVFIYDTHIRKLAMTLPDQPNWIQKNETGGYRFAATPDGIVFTREEGEVGNKRSADNGVTWRKILGVDTFEQFFVSPAYNDDATVFSISSHGQINRSSSRGETWVEIMEGIEGNRALNVLAFSPNYAQDKTIYAADKDGRVFSSDNRGNSWNPLSVQLPSGTTLNSIVVLPNKKLIAGTDHGIAQLVDVDIAPAKPAPTLKTMAAKFRLGQDTYQVNDDRWLMDALPYYKNDRVYVPVRYLAKALGISDKQILWDPDAKTVTLTRGETKVTLFLDRKVIIVNDKPTLIDVYPEITNERVYLPVRWVAEAFGANVYWNADENSASIIYQKVQE
ncbi:hypothetical protein H1S01_08205 [Heliobacterium chlorum]|uniref:Copper amine oxidase-like N-terminal domain-containing protein n=1 Tax=Heliobacterium chlorum TaxID=2698 RepID=A0ABR7T396_HELCL|nr:copper amine oxidase N-terminal domain-containing protein [Heliobacterium chlorum]MBC9784493.1 hypothetical protein [Heliobacterium chlorum]